MKFSTRTLYGLKAILVLAGRYGEGSLSVSHIAKKEDISVPYLEQILNALKKKGMVRSVRGPQGGYVLAEKPSDITLHGLLFALEEKPELPNVSGNGQNDETAAACSIFCSKFVNAVEAGLSGVTLKTLLDEAGQSRKTGKRPGHSTFHI